MSKYSIIIMLAVLLILSGEALKARTKKIGEWATSAGFLILCLMGLATLGKLYVFFRYGVDNNLFN